MARTLAILGLVALSIVVGVSEGAKDKPNIIYIMADDMGWNDVGYHNPKIQTPNIDRLASKGIELTNSYVQPVCTASRSALMTGRYPIHNGLQHLVLQPNGASCLPLENKLLPAYMKDAGYVTKMVGKWHLGYCTEECLPSSRGFDEFIGMVGGECDYWHYEDKGMMLKYTGNEPDMTNVHRADEDKVHLTIQDRNDARDMILAHKGNPDPLFMFITPNAPHSPLEPTDDMYNVHDFLDEDDDHQLERRKYLGLVAGLDDLVGSTVKALADADLSDNTVIIFQSDNGGSSIAPLMVQGFESYGNNYPLRNGKFSHHDGGVKAQTIYYDPRLKKSTQGTQRDFLMHISDWMPTFLGLAGDKVQADAIDGVNQVANLGNKYKSKNRYDVREKVLINLDTINPTEFVYKCTNRDSAFRYKDWKLLYGRRSTGSYKEVGADEYLKPAESPELPTITGDVCLRWTDSGLGIRCLFNMKDDPSETTNLFDSEPEIVEKILSMIEAEASSMVQNVFREIVDPAVGVNAQERDGVLIPLLGYCKGSDFKLEPNDPTCVNQYNDQCDSA